MKNSLAQSRNLFPARRIISKFLLFSWSTHRLALYHRRRKILRTSLPPPRIPHPSVFHCDRFPDRKTKLSSPPGKIIQLVLKFDQFNDTYFAFSRAESGVEDEERSQTGLCSQHSVSWPVSGVSARYLIATIKIFPISKQSPNGQHHKPESEKLSKQPTSWSFKLVLNSWEWKSLVNTVDISW